MMSCIIVIKVELLLKADEELGLMLFFEEGRWEEEIFLRFGELVANLQVDG
jgi:hypothetical protein